MVRLHKIFSIALVVFTLVIGSAICSAGEVVDWENGTITVEGYGTAPEGARLGQGKILAKRAAIVDAYRNIAEQVNGVSVDGTTTVKDAVVQSDIINTNVRAMIKGASIISSEYLDDGNCKVIMQIRLYGSNNSLAGAIFHPGLATETAKNPVAFAGGTSMAADVPATAKNIPAAGNYTGVVVDCRGLGLQPAMSPVIKTVTGEPIYGYKNIDSTYAINNGMVGYSHDLTSVSRAGSNPLVIKAVSIEHNNVYPVISAADAARLLVENQASHFLDKCSVVFVR